MSALAVLVDSTARTRAAKLSEGQTRHVCSSSLAQSVHDSHHCSVYTPAYRGLSIPQNDEPMWKQWSSCSVVAVVVVVAIVTYIHSTSVGSQLRYRSGTMVRKRLLASHLCSETSPVSRPQLFFRDSGDVCPVSQTVASCFTTSGGRPASRDD